MALVSTPKVNLGWKAVDFSLPATNGKSYSLQDAMGKKGLVVMFISNHCPYVKSIQSKLVRDMADLKTYGIGSIAIASNDVENYPEDDMDQMQNIAQSLAYPFPYVQDKTQTIARAYDAVCTPDFFGFDANLTLCYRGRLDDSGMQVTENRHRDLFEAMKQLATTGKITTKQHPSMGCSIKWK